MSRFFTENDMDYLKELSSEERVIFLKVLKRLAASDGVLDDDELGFIKELAVIFGVNAAELNKVLEPASDDEIVSEAGKISDRRKALELIKEMCMLANADKDLSETETMLIGRIGQAMGVELDKIQQISQWVIDRIIWLEEGKIIFEKA